MDTSYVYEIRIEGQLPDGWSDWFEGLTIHSSPDGESTLTGSLSDQAALYGVLNKIHNLNLKLISAVRLREHDQTDGHLTDSAIGEEAATGPDS